MKWIWKVLILAVFIGVVDRLVVTPPVYEKLVADL